MARTSLPPGFRFHPTDVELIMYYLKRKTLGKKLHFEAIAEVNIYKYSPWDLPDKSCLKSKDLQWYFFCPREKKYASGGRFKRATENGYWKTTGRERPVSYNEKVVGSVKTLVFHLGHAPLGKRTNWVIHEYGIKDDKLAAAGVQDTYVLCKVFEKAGLGPKNGAQYGGPVNEAEWTDDDVDNTRSHPMLLASDIQSPTQLEKEAYSRGTDIFPGSTSRSPIMIESAPPPAGHSSSAVLADETDDIGRPLASITEEEDTLHLKSNRISQDGLSGKGKNTVPSPDDDDIYSDLSPIDNWARRSESITAFSKMPENLDFIELNDLDDMVQNREGKTDFSGMQEDLPYIELKDLQFPLNSPSGVGAMLLQSEMYQNSICENLLVARPGESYNGDNSDVVQMSDQQIYIGTDAACDELELLDNGVKFTQDEEIGRHANR